MFDYKPQKVNGAKYRRNFDRINWRKKPAATVGDNCMEIELAGMEGFLARRVALMEKREKLFHGLDKRIRLRRFRFAQ